MTLESRHAPWIANRGHGRKDAERHKRTVSHKEPPAVLAKTAYVPLTLR